MARIPENVIQTVKEKANIIEIIDQFVALKKQGRNYFGFCPFHDERTPSFSVSEEKQIYKCFSCGRAGDVFSFFMEKEGLTYPEAVQRVAELGQVPVTISLDTNPQTLNPKQKEYEQLLAIHDLACNVYHHVLMHTQEGEPAKRYLLDRGFTEETIETFKLGVAPANKHFLKEVAQRQGYTQDVLLESGLFVGQEDQLMDRFRHRIMFPLRDEKGRIIAFSGRIYEETVPSDDGFQEPKYLNSPETKLFHKGTFLFNLDLARPAIRKQSEFVLCEGYMDVIATWQAGLRNSVASMGTSLTDQQVGLLKKMADRALIAYDGDRAGIEATDRAIQILRKANNFSIFVLPMLENMDPDEMIQTKGKEYFLSHVKHEQETAFAFYKRYFRQVFALDSQRGQLDYLDALLKQLLEVDSVTERSMYLNELAKEFNVSVDALTQQLNLFHKQEQIQKPRPVNNLPEMGFEAPVAKETERLSKKGQAERQLLKRMLTSSEAYRIIFERNPEWTFSNELYEQISMLYQHFRKQEGMQASPYTFLNGLSDMPSRNLVSTLLTENFDHKLADQELVDIFHVIEQETYKERLKVLRKEAESLSKEKNEEKLVEIFIEIQNTMKKIK